MSRIMFQSAREVTSMLGFQRAISSRYHLPLTLSLSRCQSTDNGSQGRIVKGTFLRKVDNVQKMFVFGHRANTRYTLVVYTLNSRKPLSADLVQEAMGHITRKCPNYQVVIKEIQDEMWWFKPDEMKMDFKVLEKGKPKFEAINDVWREGFDDVKGPLIKYRLIPAGEDEHCRLPEVKKEYPYQYTLISYQHHAIGDGISETYTSQPRIDVINAMIEGDRIDDSVPIGIFISDEDYQRAVPMFKERLLENPQKLEALKREVIKSDKLPNLYKAFPPPKVDNPHTKFVSVQVSPNVLQSFAEKCKKNGISYGTGFQAASNTALIELVQETGTTDDSYDMSVNLAINLRRYMEVGELPILGLHTGTMASVLNMDKNVRDKFWDNCRIIQKVNSNLIKTGSAVEQNVVRELCLPRVSAEDFYKTAQPLTRDYGLSNLGILDKFFPGTGKHVQITDVENYSAIHGFIYPYFIQTYSYRGNMEFSMSYATNCVTDEVASKLANKVMSIVADYSKE